jgi:hypothetical protein
MVDHHRQFRQLVGQRRGVFQVFHVKQQVKRYSVFLQNFHAADDVGADGEVVVGFVLSDVPNADEFWIVFEFEKLLFALFAGKVDPPDDSGDEVVFFSEPQHPTVFLNVVLSLHEDGLVDADFLDSLSKIGGHEVAFDFRQFRSVHPGVVKWLAELPEMLMSVDDHFGFFLTVVF